MTPLSYRLAGITMLVGVCAVALPASAQTQHTPPDRCAGFVVLPNGYAVLSGMALPPMQGMQHDTRHSHSEAGTHHRAGTQGMEPRAHTPHGARTKGADHLLGHQHGDDVPTTTGMTCVPIGDMTSTSWTAVSPSPDLRVTATSVHGTLAHNSRANESLSLRIMLDGKPVEPGHVRLLTRMPHHDRRMPGGHGPANDPDVQGLEVKPQGGGEYTVPTIDFNMGGPWLFEVQVQGGATLHKAYFATQVGEE